ncbi:MAG: FtsQ-type POTRA domain-containing protein [Ruminococcaceae bacterium]|jgi:predicted nucleic acid-binding Zn ribbon protein|nr:FtsQ-type POTRA domain-containing protein [Oscillospiraceae bacterium]
MKTTRNSPPVNRQPMSRDEKRHVISLQKHKQRKRRKAITLVLLVLLIAVVGVVLSLTVFFRITQVNVVASTIYPDEQIVEASGIKLSENMFLTDSEKAAKKIQGTLPYISDVKIKKSLTGKITLTVTETKAAMAFVEGENYLIISPVGKVLERSKLISEHVCVIEGVSYSEAEEGKTIVLSDMTAADGETVLRTGDKLLEDLLIAYRGSEEYLGGNISEIDMSDINNLEMIYEYRILLKCGDISKLDNTLKFAGAIIERLNGENPYYTGTVDLRIENKAYYNEGDFETETEPETEEATDKNSEKTEDADDKPSEEETTEKKED